MLNIDIIEIKIVLNLFVFKGVINYLWVRELYKY